MIFHTVWPGLNGLLNCCPSTVFMSDQLWCVLLHFSFLISHFSPTKTCIIFAGCEGLNTASLTPSTPSTPGSSYNKYNSLDRRRLSKLSPSMVHPKDPPGPTGFMRLSAYVPNSEPKLRPYRWEHSRSLVIMVMVDGCDWWYWWRW